MASLENTLQLFRVNLKVAFLNNTLLSVLLLSFTPVVFSIRNVDSLLAARICEQYVVLIGVILLVPIFSPEEENGIRETVEAKSISPIYVYMIRLLTAVFIMAVFISLMVLLLVLCGGAFRSGILIAGTFASALFLGTLGLCIVSVSGQLIAGYMVPVVYFILDMVTKGRYTKDFFLFSLMNSSFSEKYHLLGASVILMSVTLLAYDLRKHWR